MAVGNKPCGQEADNWCYDTSGPRTHNHNVCDAHWDKKRKLCRETGPASAPAAAPQQQQQQKRSSGTADRPAPVRGI
ncbi:MAG: hypothetical protein ACYCW6_01600 [Candidatus Xenobia bacterium]